MCVMLSSAYVLPSKSFSSQANQDTGHKIHFVWIWINLQESWIGWSSVTMLWSAFFENATLPWDWERSLSRIWTQNHYFSGFGESAGFWEHEEPVRFKISLDLGKPQKKPTQACKKLDIFQTWPKPTEILGFYTWRVVSQKNNSGGLLPQQVVKSEWKAWKECGPFSGCSGPFSHLLCW